MSNEKPDNLAAIQSWMQKALIHSGAPTEEIDAHVSPSPTLMAKERLAIYQRSYYARLLECMRQQYKALCYALGEDLFNDFARTYLTEYPSASPTLSELGARFPAFLQQSRPDAEEEEKEAWVDFMVDLAKFEWDLYMLFDAKGQEGEPYADNQLADEALALQACFSLHKYRFPVSDFYKQVANGLEPDIPAPQKTFVALCRKNYRIGIFLLLPVQFFFLREMAQGQEAREALVRTAERFETALEQAQEAWVIWREEWLLAGFFCEKK